jgi:hypothetical protein
MQSSFPYVEVKKSDRALVGKLDAGTRKFRQSGPEEDAGEWFERLCKRFPKERFVSPGGVSMYVPVSRAAVYQRINAGKLTVFMYHPSKVRKTLFGGLRKTRETPYAYIPTSECKAWAEELKSRVASFDDPGWLPDKEYWAEDAKIVDWPKHKGKVSPPKWKRRRRAAMKRSRKGLLGLIGLWM